MYILDLVSSATSGRRITFLAYLVQPMFVVNNVTFSDFIAFICSLKLEINQILFVKKKRRSTFLWKFCFEKYSLFQFVQVLHSTFFEKLLSSSPEIVRNLFQLEKLLPFHQNHSPMVRIIVAHYLWYYLQYFTIGLL